ncbi:MAG TPA: ATP-binding protein [Streptosporangiaceae bacterium]|nr:ATP-binding protein [Streptosporangiaceae bacterium]
MTDQPATSASRPEDREAAAKVWARTRRAIGQSTWSLRRRLALAFVVAGAVLAIGAVLGALALNSLVGAVDVQVNRLDPAARNASYVLASLLNEETGVRGYVLTHEQSFLQPYQRGVTKTTQRIARLHQLIDSYPDMRRSLRAVEAAAQQWRSDYALPAISAGRKGHTPGTALELTGKTDFDRIRATIGALSHQILAERQAALNRLHAATTYVVIVAITGAVAVIAAAAAAWAAMTGWVIRPLAALGAEAQVVASGGVDHELKIDGPRELMELAADVEAMRRQLINSMGDLSYKAGELERSNRELEQFAYVASHDLQEPLRKVASFCQMLESRYAAQLDDRARQYIAFAVDGAKRMQLLINELLTFSRVGQPGTTRGPVNLNAVASEAIDRLDATITDTDAQVTVAELPTVFGDATLLTQLFQNLIANSIKFRRMEEPPAIRITAQRKDDHWELACQDNGIGIAPGHAERVFVIFQRLHPRDAYPGTGIGLALCRKIVDFHGGHIWVDTDGQQGSGTTIRWTLPGPDRREASWAQVIQGS